MLPLIERGLLTETAGNLTTGRSDPRCLPHLCSPHNARRSEPAVREVQQWMPLLPKKRYPRNIGLAKLVDSVCPVQRVHDQIIALLLSQPVIERRFSPGSSNFQMLSKPQLRGFVVRPT